MGISNSFSNLKNNQQCYYVIPPKMTITSPPTTQVKGYIAYPVGGSPGGTGNFILEVFEGQNHFSRPKTIYSNALNQYNYVDFTQK
jgi:hypothetical protein